MVAAKRGKPKKPKVEETPKCWGFCQPRCVCAERQAEIQILPRRVQVLLAAEWARSVLPIFEMRFPGDLRPRKAIESAEGWAANPAAAAAADAADAADAAAGAADAAAGAARAARAAADAAGAAGAADAAAGAARAARAARAAADAAAGAARWKWIYRTYRHARGPKDATFDPRWRTESAVALARGIVAERSFDRMPILADALEEAGFDLTDELTRLRAGGDEFAAADWSVWNLLGYGD